MASSGTFVILLILIELHFLKFIQQICLGFRLSHSARLTFIAQTIVAAVVGQAHILIHLVQTGHLLIFHYLLCY